MTITELREALQDRQNQLNDALTEGLKLLKANASAEQLTDNHNQVSAIRAQMDTLRDAIAAEEGRKPAAPKAEKKPAGLGSNEYARAFAHAIVNGYTRREAAQDEKCAPLFNVMTETGGTPVGTDGGFLVPEDLEYQIHEVRRSIANLGELLSRETTNTKSGWRNWAPLASAGFQLVGEGAVINPDQQPTFQRKDFSVSKYADRVQISKELDEDNVANLYGYLARWFGRRLAITENSITLALLQNKVTPVSTARADGIDAIKTALNVTLDPMISAGGIIVTNQSGLDMLDQLKDSNLRGLLQPDPTNATQMRVLGRPLHVISDTMLPNVSSAAPVYIGSFKDFGTMFVRKGMEIATSEVGGIAWTNDCVEVRAIVRMGAAAFDDDAVCGLSLT